jgi:predicted ArsR family transcriptional regulator
MTNTVVAEVGWWSELDHQVLDCLREGPQSMRDLAGRLNLSPEGATSLLLMLAAEGKVRVTAVELAESA